jgi:hypothetical protein
MSPPMPPEGTAILGELARLAYQTVREMMRSTKQEPTSWGGFWNGIDPRRRQCRTASLRTRREEGDTHQSPSFVFFSQGLEEAFSPLDRVSSEE